MTCCQHGRTDSGSVVAILGWKIPHGRFAYGAFSICQGNARGFSIDHICFRPLFNSRLSNHAAGERSEIELGDEGLLVESKNSP